MRRQPLEEVDPARAWEAADDEPWNVKWAAHLYRRAAFGFPPVEEQLSSWQLLERAVQRGRDACVDQLLAGAPGKEPFHTLMDTLGERIASRAVPRFTALELEPLQGWWLYRMFHTPDPLRERCTLFWHNHFATSIAKVNRLEWMYQQNRMIREHALGRFPALLRLVVRDAAMLVWLDSNSNIKGRPNENLARELMELFTLGVGNYSERDIREAARAFTGWGTSGGKFVFAKHLHDNGVKTILGETGRWDGDDVVRIVLNQPAAAQFLARKLFREFISEEWVPTEELLEPLAQQLRQSDYDIRPCLETILRSRLFHSERAYRSRIKSPVEYTVGLLRSLNVQMSMERLAAASQGLGQALFAPPNVKGWDGGPAWLNSATLLARHNLAAKIIGGHDPELPTEVHWSTAVELEQTDDLRKHAEKFLELMVQDDVAPKARRRLLEFAAAGRADDQHTHHLREIVHTIVLMPEYQLA